MTLMSIPVGGDVGLEVHEDTDQFLRLEKGTAKVVMGDSADSLDQEWTAEDDWAIFVPAGKWHNIINVGDKDLKIYSIYAPVHHPHGTVHITQADAEAAEAAEHAE
jgi:mannose-6-phosphate isomerase-like protein (cupin superfamily)